MRTSKFLRTAGLAISSLALLSGCTVVNHRNANRRPRLNRSHEQVIYVTAHHRLKSVSSTRGLKRLSRMQTRSLDDIRARLLADINRGRRRYGRQPLKATSALQRTADYRTPRVMYAFLHLKQGHRYRSKHGNPYDSWVHGEYNHTTGTDYLLHHGCGISYQGSNAGEWSKGYSRFNAAPDGKNLRYSNRTARGIANNIFDGYMNHDDTDGNANGHRDNILSKRFKYIGIGIAYDSKRNLGTDNEQFGS